MAIIRTSSLFIFLVLLISCSKDKEEKGGQLFAERQPGETGITFSNDLTSTKDQNILDYLYFYNGGGVSIGDINNDGLPDIYFTGNQVKNRLYLNKGDLTFEDITDKAGVAGTATWNTGTTMADVNGDGYLDIYVSAVVGINGFMGHNQLFINNGDLTFTEKAKEYGLDFEDYSSQAAFFDVDNDGDLDMYLLNHAVHSTNSYGPASIRNKRVEESGDKLMINEDGKFVDHSEEAGIYGGANSYGLGIATADFNNDGFTDIYVSNDFHEDDYYYINNGDGTFTEKLKDNFGHTSRFSMGSDAADINNDGYVDLITLDMLPEDEKILKSSMGDDNINTHELRINNLGYQPQYTRNMLQVNHGGDYFMETALLAGIAATDWSWGAIFGDFDQDGHQDLFISNGIPRRPNDLDYIKYTSNDQIQKKLEQTKLIDQEAINKMPSGAVSNYVFSGSTGLKFEHQAQWMANDSIISTGIAYGDLDGDGDLDVVTNNVNSPATIYENRTMQGHYLKIEPRPGTKNTFGIGTKVIAYLKDSLMTRQLYTTKSWQSSSEPVIHFGFRQNQSVDSIRIYWPDRTFETLSNVALDQTLKVSPSRERDTLQGQIHFRRKPTTIFNKVDNALGIDFTHVENEHIDFNVQKLLLHKMSDLGPGVAVGDINDDGLDDVVFGSSRFNQVTAYVQDEQGFERMTDSIFKDIMPSEESDILLADFNGDGHNDLFLATGDGESIRSDYLQDKLYLGDGKTFTRDESFLKSRSNSILAKTADVDGDGDLDIFVGKNVENLDYGNLPDAMMLINAHGVFTPSKDPGFSKLGILTDAVFTDYDKDGDQDLIVVGEWMSPKFLKNTAGSFSLDDTVVPAKMNGLWQSILPFDVDEDGDMDYLLGNWGLNSKLHASAKAPLVMYHDDFDNNGVAESLIAQEKDGKYYLINDLDLMFSQLIKLRKKFTDYSEFAGKTAEEILGVDALDNAEKLEVHTLASGYLRNDGGRFDFVGFDYPLQVAPVRAMLNFDFDGDGKEEVIFAGNYFGITPYHGKFDALNGILLKPNEDLQDTHELGLDLFNKMVKDLSIIHVKNVPYLLVTINNHNVELYKLGK